MRLSRLFMGAFFVSTLSGCSLLEDFLASAIESTVVPSAIAETLGAVTQNFIAQTNLAEIDICPSSEVPSACTGGEKLISLNDCNVEEPFSFKGSLNFSFLDSADASIGSCEASNVGDKIVRSFTATLKGYEALSIRITGDSGGVSGYDPEGFQILTRGDDAFTWTYVSTGIHRTGTASAGVFKAKPLNLSTQTGTPFNITLSTDPDEPMKASGGSIILSNHAGSEPYSVELSLDPSDELIYDTCNCPTSGLLSGTATELSGTAAQMTLEFKGCGIADFQFRDELHENVKLDMCVGL